MSFSGHHPRPIGLRKLESTLGVIQLQDLTQDRASICQILQTGWGTAFVWQKHRQGPLAMSVSSSGLLLTVFSFLTSLLVFWARLLVYSAAFSKGISWTGRLPPPPSVLCLSTGVCFMWCASYIIVLGMPSGTVPLHVLSSYPSS